MSGNNRRLSHGSSMASSIMAVDRILHKESNYREAITDNHATGVVMATSIVHNGELEKSLLQVAEQDESLKQELQELLEEQRQRLKNVAAKNVENDRNVNAFVGALRDVRSQLLQQQAAGTTTVGNDNDEEPMDYEQVIQEKMQQYQTSHKEMELNVEDEKFYRDICSALGESQRRRRNNKNKNGDDDDDDDDSDVELEVVNNGGTASAQSLKCPIMGTLLEDPVKNKVCGHVYSRAGITQHIRQHGAGHCPCPVAGCNNTQLRPEQLQNDPATTMLVRRFKRREESEREQRMSQAIVGDDSDDED